MEALGVVANIAALIQITAQVTQLSYSYFREVKNAPKTQKQYLREVSALMEVLFRVETVIVETESTGLLPPRPPSLDDEALMSCYEEISRLHYELQKRKSRILRPFQDKELKPHIEMLQCFRENLSEYLSACVLVTTNATYQKVSSISIEQSRGMLLALVPPPEVSIREKPDACPGTGNWFLKSNELRCWIRGTTQLLWCYGPPGVGKSYLASIAIDHISKQTSNDVIKGAGENILGALNALVDEANAPQNAADITKMIAKAGLSQPVYLVLDGVDEMKDSTDLLNCCLGLAESGIQVLVTSRKLPHIEKKMKTATRLEITGNADDMKVYIGKRLQGSDFEEDMAEDDAIVERIIAKSGGLFLLTQLTLDELLGLATVGQIKRALEKETLGLQQAYESTLRRIDTQSKARSVLARRVLCWILYAKRRLTLEEILTAFSVDEQGLDPDNMPSSDVLLRICVGLVAVNQTDNTLGLVHTSAYEYLASLLPPKEPHLDIAQTCLRYLGQRGTMAQPCESSTELTHRFDDLKFLSYAAKHWGHHIYDQESQKGLQPLILKLINEEGVRHSSFQALQFRQGLEGELADEIFESLPRGQHALHIAAYWNLIETVKLLIEAQADPSAIDSHKWTPLHWACANNHAQVAVLLILEGADVNAPDIQGWTPLFWAAFIGNVELVRWLLSRGADHQFRSSLGWTALHWAISSGNHAAVNELLEHHSRLKRAVPPIHTMTMEQIKAYGNTISPVELAADTQDANLFEPLVNHLEVRNGTLGDARFNCIWQTARFDLPVSDNPWRTMTKGERTNGIESIVPEIGGKWNDPDGEKLRSDSVRWRSTLLLSAIRDGQLSSVQMLAKSGVNFKSGSALHIAAHRKDARFVECLLENGADPNEADYRGRTALHIAILNGFVETMAALVHGGSNVNQYMPDQSAFEDGRIFRMRRKSDASRYIKNLTTPPIILASGDLQMVHGLLLHGSDPNLTDEHGASALHGAFHSGNLRLINLLLEFGAHGNAVCSDGLPLLQSTKKCRERTCSALRRDYSGERNLSSAMAKTSKKSNDTDTLARESPKNNNWCLLNDFRSRPVTFPVPFNRQPIMLEACRGFAVETLELLCRVDRGAPHPLILFLVNVYNSKKTDQCLDLNALHEPFRRILSILRFSGSLINFYGSVTEAGVKEEHAMSSHKTTPLALAAMLPRSRDIFKDLLNHGADLYHGVDVTFDPILTAALFGDQEDLSYLLEHSLTSPNTSHWTIHLNSAREHVSPVERVCFCLQKAGVLDRVNVERKTLLHLATQEDNEALKAALVAYGANDNLQDQSIADAPVFQQAPNSSSTEDSLGTAVGNGDINAVSKLLQTGGDPNTTIREWIHDNPVLYHAARHGRYQIVSLLLEHGADTEVTDGYGWRPLHIACFRGYTDIVRILISKGADVHAPTVKWNNDHEKPSGLYKDKPWTGTALHTATFGGYSEIVEILLKHSVDVHASTGVTEKHLAYPASGPTALHIALSVHDIFLWDGSLYRACPLPSPGRLRIAQSLVDSGAMVQGVIQHFSLKQILSFAEFPALWDTLVAGDLKG